MDRWRKYFQRQNDSLQSFLPRDRVSTPFDRRRQILRARALKEAKRLIAEQALTWDGDLWRVYPLEFHVKKQGDGVVCDCKFLVNGASAATL